MLILESSCIFRLGLCRHNHENGGCDTVNTHSYLAFIGKWPEWLERRKLEMKQ